MEDSDIKDKILKGSEELFMKYGVRSISMDDIARHLSVSKKTLYQHFVDKDELVTMMSKAFLEKDKRQYEAITAISKNAVDELSKISILLKQDMEELNPSLLFDLQKFHPKAWNLWQEFKEKFIQESMVRNLKQGIEEGYFRPEINPDIITVARLVMIESSFNDQVFPKDRFNFVEVNWQIFDFFVHGMCTEKGKKLYQKYRSEITNLETIPK